MKVDITQMLIIFDEMLPTTDETQGIYWFKISRKDGICIIFAFSIYHTYVDIIVRANQNIVAASLSLEKCSEIHILDEEKKCLEILHENNKNRCFLSLFGETILGYSEEKCFSV